MAGIACLLYVLNQDASYFKIPRLWFRTAVYSLLLWEKRCSFAGTVSSGSQYLRSSGYLDISSAIFSVQLSQASINCPTLLVETRIKITSVLPDRELSNRKTDLSKVTQQVCYRIQSKINYFQHCPSNRTHTTILLFPLNINSFENESSICTVHIKCTQLHAAAEVSKRKITRRLSFQSVL